MKHKEYTATHHLSPGELKFSSEMKMKQARKVSSIFMMPGIVERKPLVCPRGRQQVKVTSATYIPKHSHDNTEAPIARWRLWQAKKMG